ncbi:uncharacterized protein [Physeter macrocephalus]|uniref:Collagen alpha-1(I) chain-like n=1 Tax=Physeter macrocephalus TaxID=9755 RepID=A0A2Y9SLH7_PHYMC|nr:uncharacterized protein LOC112064627 [Physeter catodon]|eukprot:XP_023978287.1 uncharacterized protein LOC112064627 [Physeter catodon]
MGPETDPGHALQNSSEGPDQGCSPRSEPPEEGVTGLRGPGSSAGRREPSLSAGSVLAGLSRGAEPSGHTGLGGGRPPRRQGLPAVGDGPHRSASRPTQTRACAGRERAPGDVHERPPTWASPPRSRAAPALGAHGDPPGPVCSASAEDTPLLPATVRLCVKRAGPRCPGLSRTPEQMRM